MARRFEDIGVIGLGKVGDLVALLLHDAGFRVTAFDTRERDGLPFPVKSVDARDPAALLDGLRAAGAGAVVSCLPFDLNLGVAQAAGVLGLHYFDLTEDVPTTTLVRELAQGSSQALAPQCGLAPGLIGIVGASMCAGFEELRSIELRVGALPQHPSGLLGYAFIWSPEGVVNEYLNDCEVIRGGRRQTVPAMTELETVVIGGDRYEAFLTSGGLATMCETFEGRVQRLDYKTLRYPGHCELIRFFFDELLLRDRRELAGEILVNAKPPVDDDVVHLYAAVEGWRDGQLVRHQYVRTWRPRSIAGQTWRAISWTTAASACGVVELVAAGDVEGRGFVRQEDIPLASLLATRSGAYLAAADVTVTTP